MSPDYEQMITDLENQVQEYERSIMEYECQLQLVQQEREGIRELYNKERQRYSFRIPYKIECRECEPWKRYYNSEKYQRENRERVIESKDAEIKDLKAELYDYINKDDRDDGYFGGCC